VQLLVEYRDAWQTSSCAKLGQLLPRSMCIQSLNFIIPLDVNLGMEQGECLA
jgi:hypothetical protein